MGLQSFSTTLAAHIKLLISGLSKQNFKSVIGELNQLTDLYGLDAHVTLLRGLVDQLDLREGRSQKDTLKVQLLAAILERLIDRPNFPTVLCQALAYVSVQREDFLLELCKALKLSLAQQLALALAVVEAADPEWKSEGTKLLKSKMEDVPASKSYVGDTVLHRALTFVSENNEVFEKAPADIQKNLMSVAPAESASALYMTPFQYCDVSEANSLRDFGKEASRVSPSDADSLSGCLASSNNTAKVIEELGYGCAATKEQLVEVLVQLPPLHENSVAQIAGMMSRTHSDLDDTSGAYHSWCAAMSGTVPQTENSPTTWNVEATVEAIKELAPAVSWVEAMKCLDHEGFLLPDPKSFIVLINMFSLATQDPFPIEAICSGVWANAQGQLSFIQHAVSAPPEMFSWASSARKLAPVEGLHGNKSPTGTLNQCWLSLDLLQTLMLLSESGHMGAVRTILEYPVKQCPEVLILGLAECKTEWDVVQEEVFSALLPTFLHNHPNSNLVLHRLWPVLQPTILRAFVDLHAKDAAMVSRILDICQELKALTEVLNSTPYAFSIDLAALAARREFLNLEKWLQSKIVVLGLPFAGAVLRYLREKTTTSPDQLAGNQVQLSIEIMVLFFKVLKGNMTSMPPDMQEEITRVYNAAASANPKLQGVAADQPSPQPENFAGDIEEAANSYFQQIYTSKQTIESVVQTLSGFKNSASKREQEIFACMIHNLFDEYRFFPKYPEKELLITAILFGSLIQNQLVVNLTLGIALRFVLDALRKPLGTKMFTFGQEALNQFKSRLQEWPQYCSYILQVPHMRQAEPELMEFIERTLAPVGAELESGVVTPAGGDTAKAETYGQELGTEQSASLTATGTLKTPLTQAFNTVPGTLSNVSEPEAEAVQDMDGSSVAASVAATAFDNPQGASLVPQAVTGEERPSMARTFTAPGGLQQQSGAASPGRQTQPAESPSEQPTEPLADQAPASATRSPMRSPARAASQPSLNASGSGKLESGAASSAAPSFATSLNLDTLMQAADATQEVAPDGPTVDKIHFLVNNVSVNNMPQKSGQLQQLLGDLHWPWFAQYLVVKRASIEPNFHALYLSLLDELNSRDLSINVHRSTVRNIKVLLSSEKIKSNSGERSLLKNLGSWLGQLSIAKNKPVLHRDIDPKTLILEAFQKGRMIAVIPFVAKLLEPCKNSRVFKPPNPWVIAILALLLEIYSEKDLKLNLKFEIEMLFKHLQLELKDVKPANLLSAYTRERENNPDFAVDKGSAPSQVSSASGSASGTATADGSSLVGASATSSLTGASGHASQLAGGQAGFAQPSLSMSPGKPSDGGPDAASASLREEGATPGSASLATSNFAPLFSGGLEKALPNLPAYIHISPSLQMVSERLQLKRLLPIALDRAIREIVSPVVERSCTIACMTTRELILKDFAMEPDEQRMRKAAHLMVSSLAGSLALVTCKEPLRVSIANQLRQALVQPAGIDAQLLEQTVHVATADNLDLGCALIEKAATDKALRDIDEALAPAYVVRQKHREAGQAYYDMAVYTQGRYPQSLPEVLRPKPSHLQPAQQRVYEDFARLPRTAPQPPPPPLPPYGHPSGGAGGSGLMEGDKEGLPLDGRAGDAGEVGKEEPARSGLDPLGMATAAACLSAQHGALSTGQVIDKYHSIQIRIDSLVTAEPNSSYEGLPVDHAVRLAVGEIRDLLKHAQSRDEAALAVAQKAFKRLYEPPSSRLHITVCLATLEGIRDVNQRLVKELTNWVIFSDDEVKLHREISEGLIRSRLLNLNDFDSHLAKLMNSGRHGPGTEFAAHLVRQCIVAEPLATAADFFNVLDVLGKVAQRGGAPETLGQLLEQARIAHTSPAIRPSGSASGQPSVPTATSSGVPGEESGAADAGPGSARGGRGGRRGAGRVAGTSIAGDPRTDPPGLREQAAALFEEWARVCEAPSGEAAHSTFAAQLQHAGMVKCDETTERLLRILTELAVAHCLSSEQPGGGGQSVLNFAAIDAYARLVLLLVKHVSESGSTHLVLLTQALDMTSAVVQRDAEERGPSFNPRPYFRLFAGWLNSLSSSDTVVDPSNIQVLLPFASALLSVQPLRVPGFSFAYLELIAHRSFMPRLLLVNGQKGWPLFQRLLTVMLKFMEPYLRNAKLSEPVRLLYKGTLRVLLVLLHDFPEFLCDHHFNLCDNIPPSCIQMRNLILSAFPRNMRLPDPFTPNLKVDLLPEISQSPRILADSDHRGVFRNKPLRAELDHYLKARQPSSFCSELGQRLLLAPHESLVCGTRYNVPLLNALVLYVGIQAIAQLQSKTPQGEANQSPITHSAPMDVFQRLVTELDTEGRYLLLNAIANQLRYPNNHTHYFSCVLLFLFAEAQQEIVQEQITRVLLERLIVNRPHPWGLLITFIELIKNPRYNFWSHGFTRCAPEIEKLFESVARSCMGPPPRPPEDELSQAGLGQVQEQ